MNRFRTWLALLTGLAILPVLSYSVEAASAAEDTTLSFGAFARPQGSQTQLQATAALEAQIGRKLDTVRVFETWDQAFPDSFHTWLREGERTLIMSVKPVRANGTKITWNTLATAAAGSQVDTEMRSWARRVRDFGAPIYITLHHEPEAGANTDYGTAAGFIAAWRRWVEVFRAEGATNAHFMWITTDYGHWVPTTDRRYAPKWYPGDAWVDAMAIDAYNWHVCRPNQDNAWKSLAQIIDPFRAFGALHPTKELWLAEWASWEDPSVAGRKAQWFDQARVLFAQPAYSQFVGINYFHAQATNTSFPDCVWRVDTSASSLASFAAMAEDPFWSGRIFGEPAPPGPEPPTAAFTSSCSQLTCTFTSQSTDSDGSLVETSWDFGDTTTQSGSPTTHVFPAAGSYLVRLTVVDSDGLADTTQRTVAVDDSPTSAITFVGQGTANANNLTHRVAVPAAVEAGDALILAIGSNTSATLSNPSGVTGWSLLRSIANDGTVTNVWSKVASASDAGRTITINASTLSKANLVVAAYRGTAATNPVQAIAGVAETVSRATHTTPVLSATGEGSYAVWYWTHKDSATQTLGVPAGVTARSNSSQTGSGRVTGLLADSGGSVAAGELAGRTASAAASNNKATMWTIVLNPS